jgi:hypothetical protein
MRLAHGKQSGTSEQSHARSGLPVAADRPLYKLIQPNRMSINSYIKDQAIVASTAMSLLITY